MSHPALAAATPLWVGLAGLLTTVALYMAAKRLFLRHPRIWLSPILVTPTVLLALVLLTGTTYEAYWSQSRWLTWLLGPATVAFALPIYQQRHVIARYPLTLAAGHIAKLSVSFTPEVASASSSSNSVAFSV